MTTLANRGHVLKRKIGYDIVTDPAAREIVNWDALCLRTFLYEVSIIAADDATSDDALEALAYLQWRTDQRQGRIGKPFTPRA